MSCQEILALEALVRGPGYLENAVGRVEAELGIDFYHSIGIEWKGAESIVPDRGGLSRNALGILKEHERDWTLDQKLLFWNTFSSVVNRVDPPFHERQLRCSSGEYVVKQSPHEDFFSDEKKHPTLLLGEETVLFLWYDEIPYLSEEVIQDLLGFRR